MFSEGRHFLSRFKLHREILSNMLLATYQSFIIIIFIMFKGVHTIVVGIKGNVTGKHGENGTQIECEFTNENMISVSFLAFNRSSITFNEIAIYNTLSSYLTNNGQYLKGRVKLMNITQSTTKTLIKFKKLMCIDDTMYQCKVTYFASSGIENSISNKTSISVQVPPSKPDHVSIVHTSADSSPTSTKNMVYSSSLPPTEVTSTSEESTSTMQNEIQNKTTAFNDYVLPETVYRPTSSIPSNDDFSSDIRYETSSNSIQQTTTARVIAEGDNITVICVGDVGKPPAEYVFKKYLEGHLIFIQDTQIKTSISELSENCSYYRTSNITFQVTAKDNNAVIRCVVNSSMAVPDMYVETEPLEVYSDKTTPSTSGSWLNKAKDNGTVIAIAIVVVVVLIVIGVVVVLLYRRKRTKEEYKPVDRIGSNMDQIESQETTQTVPSTSSTKKTTGYEDIDLDDTDMKFKLLCNVETIAQVKQHNKEYWKKLKEDEEREKDNPTQPPQAAVYACVNKPKRTVTTENKPPAGQQEEDVYEESKEGLYDTSGDSRHKENSTLENYDSTEKFKNEESDDNDLFSEQNSKIGANINKSYGNSEHKEEKRQVATVSPTVRMSSSSQGDGQKRKSDEIQPKTEKLTTEETFL